MEYRFLIIAVLFSSIIFGQKLNDSSVFYTDSIFSNSLNEYRSYNIYLPKTYEPNGNYKIIYAVDGKKINPQHRIKRNLDSLINNRMIEPIIYVESLPNSKIVDSIRFSDDEIDYITLRNYEYVEAFSQFSKNEVLKSRFKSHLNYFKTEFIPHIEEVLNFKFNKADRFFFGYSNGGGFGVNFFSREPEIFGKIICFSPLGSNFQNLIWNVNFSYPEVFIAYGDKEEDYAVNEYKNLIDLLKSKAINYNLEVYDGTHEDMFWENEFIELLLNIVKKQP